MAAGGGERAGSSGLTERGPGRDTDGGDRGAAAEGRASGMRWHGAAGRARARPGRRYLSPCCRCARRVKPSAQGSAKPLSIPRVLGPLLPRGSVAGCALPGVAFPTSLRLFRTGVFGAQASLYSVELKRIGSPSGGDSDICG